MDKFFLRRQKREIGELNIVPILDMFVCVIFFLLLSTTFLAYTKNTLPPSSTSVMEDLGSKAPPLVPKLFLKREANTYQFNLNWLGSAPGEIKKIKSQNEIDANPDLMIEVTKEIFKDFNKIYPQEKTIQVTMSQDIEYQKLISIMDAARDYVPDVVLFSYEEILSSDSR